MGWNLTTDIGSWLVSASNENTVPNIKIGKKKPTIMDTKHHLGNFYSNSRTQFDKTTWLVAQHFYCNQNLFHKTKIFMRKSFLHSLTCELLYLNKETFPNTRLTDLTGGHELTGPRWVPWFIINKLSWLKKLKIFEQNKREKTTSMIYIFFLG